MYVGIRDNTVSDSCKQFNAYYICIGLLNYNTFKQFSLKFDKYIF